MALGSDHVFQVPLKVITNQGELNRFLTTETAKRLLTFIQTLGDQVVGKPNNTDCIVSTSTQNILNLIGTLSLWIDEIPPLVSPQRYGNKAYRTWYQKMLDNQFDLHLQLLNATPSGQLSFKAEQYPQIIAELSPYLLDSMGNQTRLDYGTGHELHFVCWMYCLQQVGVLGKDDEVAMALRIFPTYLDLIRKLQRVYGLEPAGTHGVWSLDDYQFIPFIWGAAQLTDNTIGIKPTDILQTKIVDQHYTNYMYLACIKYINTVKKGPFHEHSPDLYNISGAASWAKIHQGMMKKFYADVMTKVPIIQHFLFGSILPFTLNNNNTNMTNNQPPTTQQQQ